MCDAALKFEKKTKILSQHMYQEHPFEFKLQLLIFVSCYAFHGQNHTSYFEKT